MSSAWVAAAAVILVGGFFYIASGKKRRPTQHDLDPTLKKNQVRITTAKKAFRRDELDPEFLARLERRDIVEIPMGEPFPSQAVTETAPAAAAASTKENEWLPDAAKQANKKKTRKQK